MVNKDERISIERLKYLYWYDPIVGVFMLKNKAKFYRRNLGEFCSNSSNGYRCLIIDGKFYYLHVLALFYMTGKWPDKGMHTDHIDGNKKNNSFSNLRIATPAQNIANTKHRRETKTGFKGVHINGNRFRARIVVGGKPIDIGFFATPEEAHKAYSKKLREVHGEFAYQGT